MCFVNFVFSAMINVFSDICSWHKFENQTPKMLQQVIGVDEMDIESAKKSAYDYGLVDSSGIGCCGFIARADGLISFKPRSSVLIEKLHMGLPELKQANYKCTFYYYQPFKNEAEDRKEAVELENSSSATERSRSDFYFYK